MARWLVVSALAVAPVVSACLASHAKDPHDADGIYRYSLR